MTSTVALPTVPSAKLCEQVSTALWHASGELEAIVSDVEQFERYDKARKFDEPHPVIRLEAVGRLYAFLRDSQSVLDSMNRDVARLESLVGHVEVVRMETRSRGGEFTDA